jgi:hypothetical protein
MLAQELNALLKENISSRGPAQALFEVGPIEIWIRVHSAPLLLQVGYSGL